MDYEPTTLPGLIDKGLTLYEQGSVIFSTKRGGEWIETTIDDYKESVKAFAMGLYKLGVRPGDRVSIHSENRSEWVICDQAILSIGAANVPIYTTQPGDQIRFILENSDAVVHIVSGDTLFEETKPVMKSLTNVLAVITLSESSHKSLRPYKEVLELGREQIRETPDLFDELKSKVKPDDVATLIYTSGTTGQPKGVMLSHNNIASNVLASRERVPFTEEGILGQNLLSYLPLSHVFERLITYIYLTYGGRIHYTESFEEIRDDFEYVKPYFFATIPRLLEKIQSGIKIKGQEMSGLQKRLYYWAVYLAESYDPENPPAGLGAIKHRLADKLVYSKIRQLFGGNLCGMISGGAALSPEVFRFINALGVYCGQGYGLTETSPVIAVQDPEHMRTGTTGRPLSNVQVRIADDKEILVKGPNVMIGYYNEPEMTRDAMTPDGWFMTGDIGNLDKDSYLTITDRKKAMFKLSTGKYVAPQNVESKLVASGFIDQAVVLGDQRKFCSAMIAPSWDNIKKRLKQSGYEPVKPWSTDKKVLALIQEEVDKANSKLSPWEQVKKFFLLEEALSIESGELTPTMKVKRSVVNKTFAEEINRLYEETESKSEPKSESDKK